MTPDDFETACHTELERLDELVHSLRADLEGLAAARPSDPEGLGERLQSAGRYAAALRQRLEQAAGETGESLPDWRDRPGLEGAIERLGQALARCAAERPRRRLAALAGTLRAGRVINRRTRKLVTALDDVRRAALAEVERATRADLPPSLPGPEEGESWLAWAWGLEPAALEGAVAAIQADFPHLIQLAVETDPSQWEAPAGTSAAPAVVPPPPATARPAAPEGRNAPPSGHEQAETASGPEPAPLGGPAAGAAVSVAMTAAVAVIREAPPAPPAPQGPSAPPAVAPAAAAVPAGEGRSAEAALAVPVDERRPPHAEGWRAGPPPEAPSPQQAAQAALAEAPPKRCWLAWEVVWHLLDQGAVGLAAHLAEALRAGEPEVGPLLPGWLLRAAALAPCVRHPSGDVARYLQEELSQYSVAECFPGAGAWNEPVRLLLAAACLRPALLAPEAGAGRILKDLHFGKEQQALYALCRAAAEFNDGRQPLDLQALKQTHDRTAWDERVARLAAEVRAWVGSAPHKTLKYQAATVIWQRWVRDGPIHQLLAPLLAADNGQLSAEERLKRRRQVAGWVAQLSDESWLRTRVDKDDNRAQKRKSIRIVGAPFDRIVEYSRQAASLAQRWLDLDQTRPAPPDDFRVRQAGRFQKQLKEAGPAALRELAVLTDPATPTAIRAAARLCRAALEDLDRLFDPKAELPSEDGSARRALHADLLRVPGLSVGEDGAPAKGADEAFVETVLRGVAAGLPDWAEAFRAQAEDRDHLATGLLLAHAEAGGAPGLDLEALSRRREEGLAECRLELEADLRATRKQVEEAVAFGLLREEDRAELMAQVRGAERRLPEVLRFGPERERLAALREGIAKRRREQVEQTRRRVAESGLLPGHPALPRIHQVLDRGDVFSANDYLEMALRDEELPSPEGAPDPLREFFPERARELDDFLARQGPREFVRRLRQGESLCGLDLARVPQNRRDQAREMLDAWFAASQRGRITEDEVRRIFIGLGLTPLRVNWVTANWGPAGHAWAEVHTEPLRERSLCPLPEFGSGANGRYRVLCLWGRPTEQDLIGRVGETHAGAALVFHFGRMTVQRRLDMARLRVEHRRTFLVLDDLLLAWLCGERGSRLPVLFACGLPFTHADPYPAAASLVPPEMFYGRQRQRDAILSPSGSCFIYGGRQLGKTALLRDAERTFNRTPGHVAVWLDLKDARVGIDRDLWPFLADVLRDKGVVPASVPANVGPDKLLAHVQQWLEADPARRVLLLLDEADTFLKKDSDGGEGGTAAAYSRVTKLKGLMDRTERRFKVVFAGLHNVQRTTRLENHPLAHYGDPICIGPLLDHGEWREARALIERPLGALGYSFASPDLVTRILSHTNYYPSLIQLYCNHLLRHVSAPGRAVFDPKASPPYVITEEHVEAAYQSEDLRKAIRARFTWTLQLDQRYEVLANLIAFHALVEDPADGVNGLTVAEARDKASGWWAEGFAEGPAGARRPLPEDAFQSLLDEMVGLGVLRKSGGRYGLRNPNVLLLMGGQADVEQALTRDREPSLEQIDPALFRAPLRKDGHVRPELRSPLTAAQDADLRRPVSEVSLLFGTGAAGLMYLQDAVEQSFGAAFFTRPSAPGAAGFAAALERLNDRRNDGTTVLWVGPEAAWDGRWVEQALAKVARLTSEKAPVRVVFAAGPDLAWGLSQAPDTLDRLRDRGARVAALEPWRDPAVRQWLEDCQFGPSDKAGREEVRRVTGNWGWLLEELYRRCQGGGPWEEGLRRLEADFAQKDFRAALYREFGVAAADRAEVLGQLAAYGRLPEGDLADLCGDAARVAAVLRWAELLRLADLGEDGWQSDPVVAGLVRPAEG